LSIRSARPLKSDGLMDVSASIKRSEEHTSELQSRFDLVCRLLLEKKKIHWPVDVRGPVRRAPARAGLRRPRLRAGHTGGPRSHGGDVPEHPGKGGRRMDNC